MKTVFDLTPGCPHGVETSGGIILALLPFDWDKYPPTIFGRTSFVRSGRLLILIR